MTPNGSDHMIRRALCSTNGCGRIIGIENKSGLCVSCAPKHKDRYGPRHDTRFIPEADDLGLKIEGYMARVAKLNGSRVDDLKRRCYGWSAR